MGSVSGRIAQRQCGHSRDRRGVRLPRRGFLGCRRLRRRRLLGRRQAPPVASRSCAGCPRRFGDAWGSATTRGGLRGRRSDPPGFLARTGGHATWLGRHFGPWVTRRVRGQSSGDGLVAKRPSWDRRLRMRTRWAARKIRSTEGEYPPRRGFVITGPPRSRVHGLAGRYGPSQRRETFGSEFARPEVLSCPLFLLVIPALPPRLLPPLPRRVAARCWSALPALKPTCSSRCAPLDRPERDERDVAEFERALAEIERLDAVIAASVALPSRPRASERGSHQAPSWRSATRRGRRSGCARASRGGDDR